MFQKCRVYVTARDGYQRLGLQPGVEWQKGLGEDKQPAVLVRPEVGYQKITGFGGAFTESAATVLGKLPAKAQEEVMNAYFDPRSGHGYTLCRSHINSCDFSLGNYALVPDSGDIGLKSFSLERDEESLIPMIKRANAVAGRAVELLGSPWSPPAWMKTTGAMNFGGKLKAEYRAAWAKYYCKYVREYEKAGIPIWGLSVQNEPAAVQPWDSCIYTAEEERDFVRDHLGPTLKAEGLSDKKLVVWDHNRDLLFERARVMLDDQGAAQYVWGVGFHWYVRDCFENVQAVHDAWPDKHLLLTEACQEGGPHHGSWMTGERYARSVIQDLNHWADGWIDWNMLLDFAGGPNHVGNLCSAPILANLSTGQIEYQSSYYYLGHFSRFIRPGATRVLTAKSTDDLEVTAAKNTDGTVAVVVMNRTENPIAFTLKDREMGAEMMSPRRSIMTIVY